MGILSEQALLAQRERARDRGLRVVMTNGCFDLLHPGHRHCLREARTLGDRLLVAVNDDASVRRIKGSGRPCQPIAERMNALASLPEVDWVVSFGEATPARLINALRPDVLVKGGDYRPEEVIGGDLVARHGGRVVIVETLPGWSTTALLTRGMNPEERTCWP